MGCCSSTGSEAPLNNNPNSTSTSAATSTGANAASKQKGKEDKIELAFKAKRANVFTEGVDLESREAFVQKRIPKNAQQTKLICKSNMNPRNSQKTTTYFYLLFES